MMSLALALALSAAAAPSPAVAGANLETFSGPVTVESAAGKHKAKKGEALASGDAVAAGKGATAMVLFADGARLKLRESSRIVLKLPEGKSTLTEAILGEGSVFAKVTKRVLGAEFRVRAGAAVASVRGTEFFTAFGKPGASGRDLWVCVNEGAVQVDTTSPDNKGVTVPAGRGILIKSGVDLTKPQAYDWTKKLNWNMDPAKGGLEDKTDLEAAYADLLDQDYR